MKVAQPGVLGNDAKEMAVPSGTTERSGSCSLACGFTSVSNRRSSLWDGSLFLNANPALRTGLLSSGPCATDFLQPRNSNPYRDLSS